MSSEKYSDQQLDALDYLDDENDNVLVDLEVLGAIIKEQARERGEEVKHSKDGSKEDAESLAILYMIGKSMEEGLCGGYVVYHKKGVGQCFIHVPDKIIHQ
jgi:hypothetical protein